MTPAPEEKLYISAKTGEGFDKLLDAIECGVFDTVLRPGPARSGRWGQRGDPVGPFAPEVRQPDEDADARHPLRRGPPLRPGAGVATLHGTEARGRGVPHVRLQGREPRTIPLRPAPAAPGPAAGDREVAEGEGVRA